MQFSNVFVIYDSTARGYLAAVAMDAQTEQALNDFSGVADAARFGSVDAALSVLSGLEQRFKGHHLHAAPLDNANPVIKVVIRRPGFAVWKKCRHAICGGRVTNEKLRITRWEKDTESLRTVLTVLPSGSRSDDTRRAGECPGRR